MINTLSHTIYALLCILMFSSCCTAQHSTSSNNDYVLLQIAQQQSNDKKSQHYRGFAYASKRQLTPKQYTGLLTELQKPTNHVSEIRRCPFQPEYVLLRNKKVVAQFDLTNCPRLELQEGKEQQRIELASKTTILQLINTFK